MEKDDDYSQTQIPSVFLEPVQPAPERPASSGRRGQFVLVSLVIGALIATAGGLLWLRNSEQADWALTRQKLESDRLAALNRAGGLEVAFKQASDELELANAKVEKYGAIEYQLNLIREKTQQIKDLRNAKPSYPHNLYMNIAATPEWMAPGEKMLKDFVAKLDVERAKLIAFKEPRPPAAGPTTPLITPTAKPSGGGRR